MPSDSEGDLALDGFFPEPERPPSPKPTKAVYFREIQTRSWCDDDEENWSEIEIRLVGTHPLWGNYLWNAARAFASYLDRNPWLYEGRCVLELGAGGGLPGIVTAKNGAAHVLLTDYPDGSLIANLEYNVLKNTSTAVREKIYVDGYIWGRPVEPLLDGLPGLLGGFDIIILSDLIFNHSQHDALLKTCDLALGFPCSAFTQNADLDPHAPTFPVVLVFYTHHRPHLAKEDLKFFEKARERGWICEKIVEEQFPPMFPNDPGDETIRSTVHGWRVSRA